MSAARKPSFRDYQSGLAALPKSVAAVVVIYGPNDFLLERVVTAWRRQGEGVGAPVTSMEAAEVDAEFIANFGQQAGMFEPACFYVVRRVEQVKTFAKLLKHLSATGNAGNRMALVLRGEGLQAPLKAELERLQAPLIPCFSPWANEFPAIAVEIASAAGLKLRQDAVRMLLDATGADLALLSNEIDRLALIFHGRADPIDAPTISPHLGMLREDDAWHLDRLLLAKQWAKATALTYALVERGEEALGLLHIIVSHCRNGLKVTEALQNGVSATELTGRLRMPPFIAKQYVSDLRGVSPERFRRTLLACQAADMTLKSKNTERGLVIAGLLDQLSS